MTPALRATARRLLGRAPRPAPAPHPVCDDLAAWSARHPGARRQVIEPAFTTTRPLPGSIDGGLDHSFAPLCSVEVPERALVAIPHARLLGHFGLVVLPDDAFVGELVALTPEGRRRMLDSEPAYRNELPSRPRPMPGSYFALLGFGVAHYYHWTHDIVMGARGIAELLPPDARIVVPETMRPWQQETLALLGLGDRELVPFAPTDCWELEELCVVTPRLKTQIDSPEPFAWFRDRVRATYGPFDRAPTRRLYLTRRHDNHWRTVNEPEVESFLARHGFETVAPGTLPFREQMALFASAEVLVGTGAGLFNMVFASPEAKILQIQEPSHPVHALWTQAAAMGMEYHYLVGETVPNPEAHDADIRVPVAALESALVHLGLDA